MSRLFAGTPFDRPPTCDRCLQPEAECHCPPIPPQKSLVPPAKQLARISVEKRKKGKVVTVIRGLAAADNELPELLTHLKNSCGAGGTLAEADELEIQGDHRTKVELLLQTRGYKTKS